MRVTEVQVDSASFDAVLRVWRAASDTLGHMPRGGFEDHARDGRLLAAVDEDAIVLGYVMFRRSSHRGDVSIVHLCVAPHARGRGVARVLFEAVKVRCCDSYEIRLKCRRDFAASGLWHRLGFVAVHDAPGRGREGTLTTWRYELAELPLFRRTTRAGCDVRAEAVIDANVFFDFDATGDGNDESQALTADWLADSIELLVTAELFNEINRRDSASDRERQRQRAAGFPMAPRSVAREEAYYALISGVLPCDTPNRISDARQLAMAGAADVLFFITRDGDILAAAERLEEILPLRIVRPHEFVRRFDELRREEQYRPERLFLGPGVTMSLARAGDIDALVALIHDGQPPPEPRRHTVAKLREILAAPNRVEVRCVRSRDTLLAGYALERSDDVLHVPFFAVERSSLGRTAARHWANEIVKVATSERRRVVRIDSVGSGVGDALAEMGFTEIGDYWVKIALPVVLAPNEVAVDVEALTREPSVGALATRISAELRAMGRGRAVSRVRSAEMEATLWPAKLTSTGIPCFIAPIQPRWAKDLFDVGLATGTLFGANASLVLNCENVYYRDARQRILTAPARVLWYVSEDRAYPESKAVRACSFIDEVVVGRAKDLFRRFKRLGVYTWNDIVKLAGDDETNTIMAFRFSKTELFERPVGWDDLQTVLKTHNGKGSPLVSPIAIDESLFVEVYTRGARRAA